MTIKFAAHTLAIGLLSFSGCVYAENEEASQSSNAIDLLEKRELACNSDMTVSDYMVEALSRKAELSKDNLRESELKQIDAAVSILNSKENASLTIQEKYKALMGLCAEGRILKERFQHLEEN